MAVTFLLAACSGGSTEPASGTRVPVDPLPGSQAEDLIVVLADGSSSPFDGDVRVPEVGSSETVRVVSVMDEERAFGWLAPWPAWFDADGSAVGAQQTGDRTIGPLSTAVQLVMGTPPLFTLDAVAQRDVMTVLAGLDEVLALADFLDVEAADGDPLEHDAYPSLLAAAVTAAVEKLGAYEFDETASVAARDPTTPGVRLRTASQLGPSQEGDFPASSLSLDQVFTRIRPLEGELEVAWDSGVPRRERGLTYYGQLYRLDASQFEDESAMRSHFLNARWTTDVTLDATAAPVPIALPADTRWVYFDLVSTALNAIESRVLDERGIPLDEEGLYAAHLYSCSAGINLAEIVRENRRNDLELLRNWPSSEASMAAPCVMFVVESALNILSVYVDLDEVLRDEQVVSLVKDVTATVVAAGDRVIQTRDMLPLVNETAKTAASMAVATLIDTGAERGVRGVGQVAFKNLAALLNIGNIISNGGQLGARLTAAAGMTPWEGVVVTVGDPWDETSSEEPFGLVAHWTFDDCGDLGRDATGNGFDGTLGGAPGCVEGPVGTALALPDAADLLAVDQDLPLPSSFTTAFWVRVGQANGDFNYFVNGATATADNAFNFDWNPRTGTLDMGLGGQAGQSSATTIDMVGSWHHLAYVNDEGDVTLYVDGEAFHTFAFAPQAVTVDALVLGQDQDCVGGCYEADQALLGDLDDVRIYDVALPQDDVAALADAGTPPPDGAEGEYLLAGAPDGTGTIGANDDLDVYLNDDVVYEDPEPTSGPPFGPLEFDAAPGDELRLVATNNYVDGAIFNDIYLVPPSGDAVLLVSGDVSTTSVGVFLDETFVLP